jgi:hypothetical protein
MELSLNLFSSEWRSGTCVRIFSSTRLISSNEDVLKIANGRATHAASALFAQPKPVTLVKVYVGSDGLAHVVDGKGKDVAIPKEKTQVAVSAPELAPDKQTAGWLIEQENCCTSYTIPTGVAIYRAKKTRLLGDGLMVYDWCFVGEGSQVALSTGTVRGMTSRHLLLYDSRSGLLLQEWSEELGEVLPTWAKDLGQ